MGWSTRRPRAPCATSDAARADYLERFYGVEPELPTHYDLVVNTDVLTVEQAAAAIALLAESL